MTRKLVLSAAAIVLLALAGFAAWIAMLPGPAVIAAQPPIAQEETERMLAALRPPKRARPVIAIIGINEATETTDYLMPYGILKRADVADVVAVATGPGPVRLYPALKVEPDTTVADFDRRYPAGADYVLVPAMDPDHDPQALAWIRAQAEKGALVIGVCAGAKVVGAAGLLENRKATTHWFYLDDLRERVPSLEYVPDRRYVVDGGVATTTGISASMPMSLTLIEAIAGRAKAESVAAELGLPEWDARHPSGAFRLTRPFALTVLSNVVALWNRETFGIRLEPGIDEVSLALVADAWSRTYRSKALTFAEKPEDTVTRSGLRIVADRTADAGTPGMVLPSFRELRPIEALDATLAALAERYGRPTADVVAMQLEYERKASRQ